MMPPTQAHKNQLRGMLPKMLDAVNREGGVMAAEEVERTWGDPLIALAVQEGSLFRVVLTKKNPLVRRRALYTKSWNREKPSWL